MFGNNDSNMGKLLNMKKTEEALFTLDLYMKAYPVKGSNSIRLITDYRTYVVEEMDSNPYQMQFDDS